MGEKLRAAIDASGKTVSQVAKESGVSRSTVFRMMSTGEGMMHSWQAVARVLDMGVSDLADDSREG